MSHPLTSTLWNNWHTICPCLPLLSVYSRSPALHYNFMWQNWWEYGIANHNCVTTTVYLYLSTLYMKAGGCLYYMWVTFNIAWWIFGKTFTSFYQRVCVSSHPGYSHPPSLNSFVCLAWPLLHSRDPPASSYMYLTVKLSACPYSHSSPAGRIGACLCAFEMQFATRSGSPQDDSASF